MAFQVAFDFVAAGEKAILAVWDAIADAAAKAAKVMTQTASVSKSVATATVKPVVESFAIVANELGKLAVGGGKVVEAFNKMQSSFMGFAGDIIKYVEKISPATVEMFTMAVSDLMATIGEALMPVLQVFTEVVEKLGDYIANIDLDKYIDSLLKVLEALADAFFQILDAAQPLIQVLVDNFAKALELLVPLIEPISELFISLMEAVEPFVALVQDVLLEVLAQLIPPLVEIVDAVTGVIDALKPLIDIFVDQLANVIDIVLMPLLKLFCEALVFLGETLKSVVNFIADIVEDLTFGEVDIHIKDREQKKAERAEAKRDRGGDAKSRATAVRGLSTGSIESFSDRALQAAAKVGVGKSGPTSEERRTKAAEESAKLLKDIADNTKKNDPQGKQAANEIAKQGFGDRVENLFNTPVVQRGGLLGGVGVGR